MTPEAAERDKQVEVKLGSSRATTPTAAMLQQGPADIIKAQKSSVGDIDVVEDSEAETTSTEDSYTDGSESGLSDDSEASTVVASVESQEEGGAPEDTACINKTMTKATARRMSTVTTVTDRRGAVATLNGLNFVVLQVTQTNVAAIKAALEAVTPRQLDDLKLTIGALMTKEVRLFTSDAVEYQTTQDIGLRSSNTMLALTKSKKAALLALLIQGAQGHTVHVQKCTACAKSSTHGVFNDCVTMSVVLENGGGQTLMENCCTNCGYDNNFGGCSFNPNGKEAKQRLAREKKAAGR